MSTDLNSVLGAFGSGTTITALGRTWSFVFDVPAMAAAMEEMCKKWRREQYEAEVKNLPGKDVPGSFDNQMATRLFDEFRADIKGGACAIAHYGNPSGGTVYQQWIKTREGQMSGLLAALQIKHPDATYKTLLEITNAAPDQMRLIVTELGNAMRAAVPKLAAALKESSPEVSAYLEAKATELETTLSGLPA